MFNFANKMLSALVGNEEGGQSGVRPPGTQGIHRPQGQGPWMSAPGGGGQMTGSRMPGQNMQGFAGPGMSSFPSANNMQGGQMGNNSMSTNIGRPGVTGPAPNQPGLSGQGMNQPGISTPGMHQQGVSVPGITGAGFSGQGMSATGLGGPGMSGPGMSGPAMSGPGMTGPGMGVPGITGSGSMNRPPNMMGSRPLQHGPMNPMVRGGPPRSGIGPGMRGMPPGGPRPGGPGMMPGIMPRPGMGPMGPRGPMSMNGHTPRPIRPGISGQGSQMTPGGIMMGPRPTIIEPTASSQGGQFGPKLQDSLHRPMLSQDVKSNIQLQEKNPNVDLSELSAAERAHIENVMAKAQQIDSSGMPKTGPDSQRDIQNTMILAKCVLCRTHDSIPGQNCIDCHASVCKGCSEVMPAIENKRQGLVCVNCANHRKSIVSNINQINQTVPNYHLNQLQGPFSQHKQQTQQGYTMNAQEHNVMHPQQSVQLQQMQNQQIQGHHIQNDQLQNQHMQNQPLVDQQSQHLQEQHRQNLQSSQLQTQQVQSQQLPNQQSQNVHNQHLQNQNIQQNQQMHNLSMQQLHMQHQPQQQNQQQPPIRDSKYASFQQQIDQMASKSQQDGREPIDGHGNISQQANIDNYAQVKTSPDYRRGQLKSQTSFEGTYSDSNTPGMFRGPADGQDNKVISQVHGMPSNQLHHSQFQPKTSQSQMNQNIGPTGSMQHGLSNQGLPPVYVNNVMQNVPNNSMPQDSQTVTDGAYNVPNNPTQSYQLQQNKNPPNSFQAPNYNRGYPDNPQTGGNVDGYGHQIPLTEAIHNKSDVSPHKLTHQQQYPNELSADRVQNYQNCQQQNQISQQQDSYGNKSYTDDGKNILQHKQDPTSLGPKNQTGPDAYSTNQGYYQNPKNSQQSQAQPSNLASQQNQLHRTDGIQMDKNQQPSTVPFSGISNFLGLQKNKTETEDPANRQRIQSQFGNDPNVASTQSGVGPQNMSNYQNNLNQSNVIQADAHRPTEQYQNMYQMQQQGLSNQKNQSSINRQQQNYAGCQQQMNSQSIENQQMNIQLTQQRNPQQLPSQMINPQQMQNSVSQHRPGQDIYHETNIFPNSQLQSSQFTQNQTSQNPIQSTNYQNIDGNITPYNTDLHQDSSQQTGAIYSNQPYANAQLQANNLAVQHSQHQTRSIPVSPTDPKQMLAAAGMSNRIRQNSPMAYRKTRGGLKPDVGETWPGSVHLSPIMDVSPSIEMAEQANQGLKQDIRGFSHQSVIGNQQLNQGNQQSKSSISGMLSDFTKALGLGGTSPKDEYKLIGDQFGSSLPATIGTNMQPTIDAGMQHSMAVGSKQQMRTGMQQAIGSGMQHSVGGALQQPMSNTMQHSKSQQKLINAARSQENYSLNKNYNSQNISQPHTVLSGPNQAIFQQSQVPQSSEPNILNTNYAISNQQMLNKTGEMTSIPIPAQVISTTMVNQAGQPVIVQQITPAQSGKLQQPKLHQQHQTMNALKNRDQANAILQQQVLMQQLQQEKIIQQNSRKDMQAGAISGVQQLGNKLGIFPPTIPTAALLSQSTLAVSDSKQRSGHTSESPLAALQRARLRSSSDHLTSPEDLNQYLAGMSLSSTPIVTPRSLRDDSSDTMSETDSAKSSMLRRKLPHLPPDQEGVFSFRRKIGFGINAKDRVRSQIARQASLDGTSTGSSYSSGILGNARSSSSMTNLNNISKNSDIILPTRPGSALGLLRSKASNTGGYTSGGPQLKTGLPTCIASLLPPDLHHLIYTNANTYSSTEALLTAKLREEFSSSGNDRRALLEAELRKIQDERRRNIIEKERERDLKLRSELDRLSSINYTGPLSMKQRNVIQRRLGMPNSAISPLAASPRLRRRGHQRQMSDPKLFSSASLLRDDRHYSSNEYFRPHWDPTLRGSKSNYLEEEDVIMARQAGFHSSIRRNSESGITTDYWDRCLTPTSLYEYGIGGMVKQKHGRRPRKPRSWHPSPYASDDDDDMYSREEKKQQIKAEIARRRQQIEENARLHEELLRLARLRENAEHGYYDVRAVNFDHSPTPSAKDSTSVLRSIDEILRDVRDPSTGYYGHSTYKQLSPTNKYSGAMPSNRPVPRNYYGSHGQAPRYPLTEEDKSIARLASTFQAGEFGEYAVSNYGRIPEVSPLTVGSLNDYTPAMPLLPDMPTRSRKLLEDLGSSPIAAQNQRDTTYHQQRSNQELLTTSRHNFTTSPQIASRSKMTRNQYYASPSQRIERGASLEHLSTTRPLHYYSHDHLDAENYSGQRRWSDDFTSRGGYTNSTCINPNNFNYANKYEDSYGYASNSPIRNRKSFHDREDMSTLPYDQERRLPYPNTHEIRDSRYDYYNSYEFDNRNGYYPDEVRPHNERKMSSHNPNLRRICLTRDPKDKKISGNGLGMKVIGGKEIPNSNGRLGAYVAKITPGGVVAKLGEFAEGDLIVQWNGISLLDKTHEETQKVLNQTADEVEVEIELRSDVNMLRGTSAINKINNISKGPTIYSKQFSDNDQLRNKDRTDRSEKYHRGRPPLEENTDISNLDYNANENFKLAGTSSQINSYARDLPDENYRERSKSFSDKENHPRRDVYPSFEDDYQVYSSDSRGNGYSKDAEYLKEDRSERRRRRRRSIDKDFRQKSVERNQPFESHQLGGNVTDDHVDLYSMQNADRRYDSGKGDFQRSCDQNERIQPNSSRCYDDYDGRKLNEDSRRHHEGNHHIMKADYKNNSAMASGKDKKTSRVQGVSRDHSTRSHRSHHQSHSNRQKSKNSHHKSVSKADHNQPPLGMIELQICYDVSAKILYVTVLKAKGLLICRDDGGTQPELFVRVSLLPGRRFENDRETRPAEVPSKPEWNLTMVYPNLQLADLKKKYLEVTAWSNYGANKPNEFLGETVLDLSDSSVVNEDPKWYQLQEMVEPDGHQS